MTESEQIRHRRRIDQGGWAHVYHVLTLDAELSDGALRLYLLLLRYAQQKDHCWPGISRLAKDLARGETVVKARLAELTQRGFITRERRFGSSSITWLEDLEDIYGQAETEHLYGQSENRPIEQTFEQTENRLIEQVCEEPENRPIVGRKTDRHEEKREKNKQDGGGSDSSQDEQDQAVESLVNFGVAQTMAKRIARKRPLADIQAWLSYADQASGLSDRAAFVVRRLLDGEAAPPCDSHHRQRGNGLETSLCRSCWRVLPISHLCVTCGRCFDCCECEAAESS